MPAAACCSSHQPTTQRWSSGLAACCERVKGACALVVGGCSCTARLGGVRALGWLRRRCGRVRAAWVLGLCVQSSVMSDNYQSTTSECAKPACNHPFDSIQRADSHSTHATSTISVCGLDVVEFPQCLWTVTVLNREQMQKLMPQPW
jgi:hypothetical protein